MINILEFTIFSVALFVSLSEAVLYPGVISKHLMISPLVIYTICLIVSIYLVRKQKKGIDVLGIKLSFISLVSTIFFGILYFVLMILENLNYSNFVFSKFHVYPEQLIWPFFISVIEYIITAYLYVSNKRLKNVFFSLFHLELLLIPFAVIIFANNIIGIIPIVKNDLIYLIQHPNATYDQKMEHELGKTFYDYVLFIKANTPENSKILIPPWPAYPWPQTGNGVYMRYFLYPRTLVSGDEYSPNTDLAKEDFDYVLITWGETPTTSGSYTHGWPKFNVDAKEIIFWTPGGEITTESGNYVYKKVEGQDLWGLIKLKK
jgi:hypothetical protein